jgi:hypothetical protein
MRGHSRGCPGATGQASDPRRIGIGGSSRREPHTFFGICGKKRQIALDGRSREAYVGDRRGTEPRRARPLRCKAAPPATGRLSGQPATGSSKRPGTASTSLSAPSGHSAGMSASTFRPRGVLALVPGHASVGGGVQAMRKCWSHIQVTRKCRPRRSGLCGMPTSTFRPRGSCPVERSLRLGCPTRGWGRVW